MQRCASQGSEAGSSSGTRENRAVKVNELTREERYEFLRVLGCIVCRNHYDVHTPPVMHHIREGQGKMRAPDDETIPLCPPHHLQHGYGLSFHDGPGVWKEKFGTERDLLDQVNRLIQDALDHGEKA